MPRRLRGVVDMAPDCVCEIVSSSHQRKDTPMLFLLQRHRVPFYWLIWPEDRTLIVRQFDGDTDRIAVTVTLVASEGSRTRILSFDGL